MDPFPTNECVANSAVAVPHASAGALRKTVLACMMGNALEWYDFILYGYFVTLISQQIFPPAQDPMRLLLQGYGIFFLGFLMRPLGAVIFGLIGDRWGRKRALMASIFCMAVPTFLIGLIPTYAMVGLWAPLILTLLRLLQGLSMGGEFTGSMICVAEEAPPARQGLWASLVMCSALLGLLMGSLVCLLLSFGLESDALAMWGWRLPFLASIVGSSIGWSLRRQHASPSVCAHPMSASSALQPRQTMGSVIKEVQESPKVTSCGLPEVMADEENQRKPADSMTNNSSHGGLHTLIDARTGHRPSAGVWPDLKQLWRHLLADHWRSLVCVFLLDSVVAVGFFMVCLYLMAYNQTVVGMTYAQAVGINTVCMALFAAFLPAMGWLSDRLGPRRVMAGSIVLFALMTPLSFFLLNEPSVGHGGLWGQGMLVVCMSGVFAPLPCILVRAFPSGVRYSGVSMAHNLSMALFGGSVPEVATFLIHRTGSVYAPAVLIITACGVSLWALHRLKPQGEGQ